MRTRRLRGAVVALLASAGFGVLAGSARAEKPAPGPDAGAAAAREPTPAAPGVGSPAEPDPPADRSEEWWSHAREVLFSDLELSAEQARGVDAIIESQRRARKRAEELKGELAAARREGDAQRTASLRAQLREERKQLKNPYSRMEQMRALLSEEQRPTFDRNRARLVAEGQAQQAGKARSGRRAKRPAAAAEVVPP